MEGRMTSYVGGGNGHDPLDALSEEVGRRLNGVNGSGHGRPTPAHRYLVTGCAGFIGSHLVQALTAHGCSVVGVDSFTDNYSRSVKERNVRECCETGDVRFFERDLALEPVGPLVEGVDGVFHLAARPGVRTSWGANFASYLHDNLLATQRVFAAAAEHQVRVVYASSSSIYGDAEGYPLREDATPLPVSPYGMSKVGTEALASSYMRSLGLDAVGLRYFSVYGPRQRPDMAFAEAFECLAQKRSFGLFGDGRQTRDFTYVDDVIDATLKAMERAPAGRIYNVGGGSETSLLDALAVCEEVAGQRLDVRGSGAGTGDARRTIADIGLATAELDWTPTTTLKDGLRAQAESSAASADAGARLAWALPG
jgi:UDP-glucuronate 4-epimerase